MILIPDIKFPSNCEECPCQNDGVCQAKSIKRGDNGNYLDYQLMNKERAEDCPLIRMNGGYNMNAKQSLKKAAARIVELEDFNRRASAEIKGLNMVIDSVIAGEKTYCDWCEEQNECQRECKGTGCTEWWLMMNLELPETEEGGEADGAAENLSKTILSAGPEG